MGVRAGHRLRGGVPRRRQPTSVVTISATIGPAAFGAAAGAIAEAGGNIERIVRIARYPVVAYELIVSAGDLATLRENLMRAGQEHRFDVAVQEERLEKRLKRLIVIDVDSTLIQDEVIDLPPRPPGSPRT